MNTGSGHLKGKVVIVTGGARGIGRGIALRCAEEGARVVVADYGGALERLAQASSGPADQVAALIRGSGGEAVACGESVATMAGGQRIVDLAMSSFGRLDGVVCCAGLLTLNMIWDMSEAEWDDVMAAHLKGHFSCTKAAARVMLKQRSGRLVYFSSTAALRAEPYLPSYCAAKAGILALTRSSALALAAHGVRVNCILPGGATRMTDELYRYMGVLSDSTTEVGEPLTEGAGTGDAAPNAGLKSELSAGTWRDPANVAPFVTFLLSDKAGDVTGLAFAVVGHQVTVVRERTYGTTIRSDGPWDFEDMAKRFDGAFAEQLQMTEFPWPPP